MKRRDFGKKLASGVFGAGVGSAPSLRAAAAQTARVPRKNTLMHVGGDYHSVAGAGITSKENLEYNLRHGVKHLTAQVSRRSPDGAWDLDELKMMRDSCDKYGIVFEAIRMDADYITLRKGPQRDRRLDNIAANIQKAALVGVRLITYHWTVIPIRRNRRTPGRGGSTYNGFQLEDNWRDLPVGPSGRVTSDDYWERIRYFLEKIGRAHV